MSEKCYKRLGNYIELVQERNKGALITNLMGVSIAKKFIPSIANIIGTDLSTYRIVHPGNFAFCPVTSRNGEKITIARYKGKEDCIISQAYLPFRVIDEDELSPDYLMMWVMRPEFDRYARFHSHGSVRELFSWEEMCNVYLPIPSIEEQRKIVAEYQAVEQRIDNNNRLIKALENTAQAIYHHTFVENINPENLPDGWRIQSLSDVSRFKVGGDCPEVFSEVATDKCIIPIYSNGEYLEGLYGYTDKPTVTESSFTISARGNVGTCFLRRHQYRGIVRLVSVIPIDNKMLYYLYFNISAKKLRGDGSAQSQITVPQLSTERIVIPQQILVEDFYEKCEMIFDDIENLKKEKIILNRIKSLLLSKLS